jgi:hypothetical protein
LACCSERAAVLVAIALVLVTVRAKAGIQTCVSVDAPRDRAAFERLVRSELGRHPSHDWADTGCEARLRVELIVIDEALGGGRYVTGWLDGEVPHRVEVGEHGLGRAVEQLLTVVLHNDPRRLRGPETERDLFSSGVRALRINGHTYVGAEAYELGTWVGGKAQTLSGLAAFIRREVGSVHVAVRFGGAHDFGERTELRLETDVLAELEAAVWSSRTADTAAFAGLTLSFEYQRFTGPAPLAGPGRHGSASASGFAPAVRIGVELFRVTHTRALFFVSARVPTFVSSDPDSGVMDQWTPTLAVGGGVAF